MFEGRHGRGQRLKSYNGISCNLTADQECYVKTMAQDVLEIWKTHFPQFIHPDDQELQELVASAKVVSLQARDFNRALQQPERYRQFVFENFGLRKPRLIGPGVGYNHHTRPRGTAGSGDKSYTRPSR